MAVAILGIIIVLILVWLGIKLLLWPIRWTIRGIRASAIGVPPAAFLAAAVVTVILAPNLFIYVAGFILRLAHLLVLDLPIKILTVIPSVVQACGSGSASSQTCAVAIGQSATQFWLQSVAAVFADWQMPPQLARAQQLNFRFVHGQRPVPNAKEHIPTTVEWARKWKKEDMGILTGKAPYSETVPNVDEGFTAADVRDPARAEAIYKVIRARLAKAQQDRPFGFLVRHAPADDVRNLQQLADICRRLFI